MSIFSQYIRDGVNQLERLNPALDPAGFALDDQNYADLLRYTFKLAEQIRYYDNQNQSVNHWQAFFKEFLQDPVSGKMRSQAEIEKELSRRSDFDPHFALFLCFLKLHTFLQQDINTLTQRHLDFYFEKVLRIKRKPAEPDQVHVIFQLAKNVSAEKLEATTLLKTTQKDSIGNPIRYRLDREMVVNQAKVASLKSVFIDRANVGGHVYAAPVANSLDGLGTEFPAEGTAWPAFGESQRNKPSGGQTMADAELGFAIASPELLLREGTRTIDVNLYFKPLSVDELGSFASLSNVFSVCLSGETEWIVPETTSSKLSEISGFPGSFILSLNIRLGTTQPSVVAYSDQVLGGGYATNQPLMKVLIKQEKRVYGTLRLFEIESLEINSTVNGIKNLTLANDLGPLNAAKPFFPFGTRPNIGSGFFLGSEEVFAKKLSSLDLHIDWHNLPDLPNNRFKDYYAAYTSGSATSINNSSFQVNASLQYKGVSYGDVDKEISIFQSTNPASTQTITIEGTDITSRLGADNILYDRRPNLARISPQVSLAKEGFMRFSLTGPNLSVFRAFGHQQYPNLLTERAINQAKGTGDQTLPNPPYTPEIKNLSLDYVSSYSTSLGQLGLNEKIFQIAPFGNKEILATDVEHNLVPHLITDEDLSQVSGELAYKGLLYLGLEAFDPPRSISLLVKLAEGTAEVESEFTPSTIKWTYLSQNTWKPIEAEDLLIENTRSFRQSGIISFNIPGDATGEHQLMPKDLHWIRAEILNGASVVNKVIEIRAQAALATLDIPPEAEEDQFNAHLSQPLATKQVEGLLKKKGAIKSVSQDFVSVNGRQSEQGNIFYTRVSERLRHKNRAISAWDYEHLVLEAFPSVFKVRCLNHLKNLEYEAPGALTLIVVSNLRNQNSGDLLQPRTSETQLAAIADHLRSFSVSPFVDLKIENPIYEEILVDFQVAFFLEYDPGFYINVLNQEILRFLSPWAFEEGKDIQFGGKIYKSDIQGFIESREYVDHITNFKVFQLRPPNLPPIDGVSFMKVGTSFVVGNTPTLVLPGMTIGDDFIVGQELEFASASSPKSILVSVAKHRIREFEGEQHVCEGFSGLGIGLMTVGIDFQLSITDVFV